MHPFANFIKNNLERCGYFARHIGETPAAITIEFKTLVNQERFFVVYLRQAPAHPEDIEGVFKFHNAPVLFVVDQMIIAEHLLAFINQGKAPPLWMRALHAIYYGRIYTWFSERRVIQALHFDWDKKTGHFSEPIEIDRIILTETDSLLRDYPGHFKIARFSDRAFWKGERPQKPPKRNAKQSSPNEEFFKEEYKRWAHDEAYGKHEPPNYQNHHYANYGANKPPPPHQETIFEMFERLKREEMRRRQAQQQYTYSQRPNRYQPSGDEWFMRLMGGGDLEGAQKIYRELAKQYHPDVNREPGALEIMQKINAAYDRVKDILV